VLCLAVGGCVPLAAPPQNGPTYVSEDIVCRWVVLGVGKGALDWTFVNVENTKAFRAKPYGAAGDCRCQFAALNLIHKASEVRVV
jgi:hypothetical protein